MGRIGCGANSRTGGARMTPTLPRYLVAATFNGEHALYWGDDNLGKASRLIIHALENGATYACQQDTQAAEETPREVSETERANLASLV